MSSSKVPLIPNEKIFFQTQPQNGSHRQKPRNSNHRSHHGSLTPQRFSWLLRHSTAVAQHMDPDGFVGFDTLLSHCPPSTTKERMLEIVAQDQKGRFEIRGDEIRAVNGHSALFCDNYEVVTDPPEFLFHATNDQAVPLIMAGALKRMTRHYIHLHGSPPPKTSVRYRILRIRPPKGHVFYRTKNGYFLCREDIPAKFIEVIN